MLFTIAAIDSWSSEVGVSVARESPYFAKNLACCWSYKVIARQVRRWPDPTSQIFGVNFCCFNLTGVKVPWHTMNNQLRFDWQNHLKSRCCRFVLSFKAQWVSMSVEPSTSPIAYSTSLKDVRPVIYKGACKHDSWHLHTKGNPETELKYIAQQHTSNRESNKDSGWKRFSATFNCKPWVFICYSSTCILHTVFAPQMPKTQMTII